MRAISILTGFFKTFRRDPRGVAAVEFALVAPVMIIFYFGMAELCQAMMAERKALRTASSVGDLIAQTDIITPTGAGGVDDVFAISKTIMAPFPTTGALAMCTASLVADNAGAVTVAWSRASSDTTCPAKLASYTPPSNLIAANESLIMARVKYTYTSPVKFFLKTDPVFTKLYYLRPRKSQKVTCAAC